VVLTALAEGLDPSAAERVFGYRQATITTWLARAARARADLARALFSHFAAPAAPVGRTAHQAALLYTGASFSGWPSTPSRAILPVLQLGPRTQNMAHRVIHSLRQILAAFLSPALHQ
jgi:hypothetical protein